MIFPFSLSALERLKDGCGGISTAKTAFRAILRPMEACDTATLVLHVTARSIRSAFDTLALILEDSGAHLMGVTETWIHKDDQSIGRFDIGGYRFISHPSLRVARGGGVGLYIRKELIARD